MSDLLKNFPKHIFLVFFLVLFINSCQVFNSEYSIKNTSSEIIDLILSDGQLMKILPGLCFKLIKSDFPLTVSSQHKSSKLFLSEAGHYVINNLESSQKSSTPCQSDQIE